MPRPLGQSNGRDDSAGDSQSADPADGMTSAQVTVLNGALRMPQARREIRAVEARNFTEDNAKIFRFIPEWDLCSRRDELVPPPVLRASSRQQQAQQHAASLTRPSPSADVPSRNHSNVPVNNPFGFRWTIWQVQEANYLNSLVVDSDPTQQFAKRASIREAYHDICSEFAESAEKREAPELFDRLRKTLESVDLSYQNVGAGGKELAADADSLLSMASALLEQMKTFRSTNSERVITAASFAEALISFSNSVKPSTSEPSECSVEAVKNPLLEEDGESMQERLPSSPSEAAITSSSQSSSSSKPKITLDQWAWLGRQDFGTLTYDVSFNYQSLRSVVSYDTMPAAAQKPKKERVKIGKDPQDAAIVLNSEQSVSNDDELSVAHELDKLIKILKREWKVKPSVDFFSFVIDAEDFAKTVENMFYISFLVKDGRVRLSIGEDGLPVLLHVSKEERQRLHVDDRSAAVTNQAIISFDYETWERMVEALNLRSQ